MTTLHIALQPCPFCGSPATFMKVKRENANQGGEYIDCTNKACGATSVLMFSVTEDVRPLLAEKWNRRAIAAPTQEQPIKPECVCDSPSWCKQYARCNRKTLGLPYATPDKLCPQYLEVIMRLGGYGYSKIIPLDALECSLDTLGMVAGTCTGMYSELSAAAKGV